MIDSLKVVLLAGGVGGAKLADGLAQILPAENLTVIGNTGDDFQHLGLTICPDIDTLTYTLARESNDEQGWGRRDESWRAMDEVRRLGGPDWFSLGDLDLGLHLTRTHLLQSGESLTNITLDIAEKLNVGPRILPMADQPAPTVIETTDGERLAFQEWFVQRQWQPEVEVIHLPDNLYASPQVLQALSRADVVIIGPSNPFVSIAPILNVYPIRPTIADVPEIVIGVTPIIDGKSVKGPAAKLMRELRIPASAEGILGYYNDLLDGFVYDSRDDDIAGEFGIDLLKVDTLMTDRDGRRRLANDVMNFALTLRKK